MSNGRYILDPLTGDPVEEPDLFTWGLWMEGAFRRVLLTDLLWCSVLQPRSAGQFKDIAWAAAVFVLNHPDEKLRVAFEDPASADRFMKRLQEDPGEDRHSARLIAHRRLIARRVSRTF